MTGNPIIDSAIRKAGGIKALARALGITHNSIYSWTRIPTARLADVERVTGIPRAELRPDIFGPRSDTRAEA